MWAKGGKIEQVRQHLILGLTFGIRMIWFKHIKNTKTRAENKINIINIWHIPHGELTKEGFPGHVGITGNENTDTAAKKVLNERIQSTKK
jgi:hypothetical protein